MSYRVTVSDIEQAAHRISPHVRQTPILDMGNAISEEFRLILKLEHLQVTGSFKPRGAFSLLTAREVPEAGVVAASGGNFGIAVAYAAARLGHRATIFVPATSPAAKIDRIKSHAADVRVIPGYYDEAREASELFAQESGALYSHAYDQLEVVAGQGTLGLEIEKQTEPDLVVVAVGGGGLIGGIASWMRGRVRVVASEPERCASFHAAVEQGQPVDVEVSGIAASSLGARSIGRYAWEAREWVEASTLVGDDEIEAAQRWIWSAARLAVEPAAATPVAALRSGEVRPPPGSNVVAVLSGGNLDPATVV